MAQNNSPWTAALESFRKSVEYCNKEVAPLIERIKTLEARVQELERPKKKSR